jgi:hypothetical protein
MTVQWQEQVSLKPYNTFGIDVKARYFSQAQDDDRCAGAGQASRGLAGAGDRRRQQPAADPRYRCPGAAHGQPWPARAQ